jgi:hypothetical protein
MQYTRLKKLSSKYEEYVDPDHDNHLWYLEEKIDGSQLSWTLAVDRKTLEFYNKEGTAPNNNIFGPAIKSITEKFSNKLHLLNPDYTYHGETLCKPKHNVITYTRFPRNYWICYDIYDSKLRRFLHREEKVRECLELDLECVQVLYTNTEKSTKPHEEAKKLIAKFESREITSQLGGMIEGLVLKNHAFFKGGEYLSRKKKITTSIFKEKQKVGTKGAKDFSPEEFLDLLGSSYDVGARFSKAVIHLKEADKWNYENTTINIVEIKEELDRDFDKEYKSEVKDYLHTRFVKDIMENPESVEHIEFHEHLKMENPQILPEEGKDDSEIVYNRKFYREKVNEIKDFLWKKYNMIIKQRARKSLQDWFVVNVK